MPSCREECREVFVALIGREEFTSVRVCGVRSEEFTPHSRTRRELNFITRSRMREEFNFTITAHAHLVANVRATWKLLLA